MSTLNDIRLFQRLPGEIRDQIYAYFMPWVEYDDKVCARRKHKWNRINPNESLETMTIMRTSKVINQETSSILYDG